jgi:hypothetical protein
MTVMQRSPAISWRLVFQVLLAALVLKVTAEVVANYRNYLPPNFNADFLRGREAYFHGRYQWAFYAHIASGPVTLLAGLLLLSDRFRLRFPAWHRRLGRMQAVLVLLLIVPSGLWMAAYAAPGPAAGVGFALLSIATGTCMAFGWRRAVQRRFAEHRRWMWRTYLLLCSAVMLRVLGGLGSTLAVSAAWYDPLASWLSWVLPIAVYEVGARWTRRDRPATVPGVVGHP